MTSAKHLVLALLCIGCSNAVSEGVQAVPAAVSAAGQTLSISTPDLKCPVGDAHLRSLDDGNIEQWCVEDDKLHGPFRQYHSNGNRAVAGYYHKGEKYGVWQWWHVDGTRLSKGKYWADKATGIWNWWHPNGKMQETGDHLNGMRAGLWQTWHANGTPASEGHYVNDRQDGEWTYYSATGALTERRKFRSGRLL